MAGGAAGERRPTVQLGVDRRETTPGMWTRRAFIALLCVIVVAGLLGAFGVHSRTVSAHGDSATLDVHYASIARAGLSTPFDITVHQPGGFDGPVILAVSRSYLELFDINSVNPQPDSETGNPANVVWHYDKPSGSTFVVSVDLSVQAGRHRGTSGHVALEQKTGRALAKATFHTTLAP